MTSVDMGQIAHDAAKELGAQIGVLTAELIAQRQINAKQAERIAELEKPAQEEARDGAH